MDRSEDLKAMFEDLPPDWFDGPETARQDTSQGELFETTLGDLMPGLRVTRADLVRWHQRGWLSFAPDLDARFGEFYDARTSEIRFIRSLVMSGLGDARMDGLLAELQRPYAYDAESMTWSVKYGWVVPSYRYPNEVIDEELNGWLEGLAEWGDFDRLREIKGKVIELLEWAHADDEPEEAPGD